MTGERLSAAWLFPLKKSIQTELSTTINAAPQPSLLEVNIERNFAKECAHAGLLPCADQQLQSSLDRCSLGWQAAQLYSLGNQTVIDLDKADVVDDLRVKNSLTVVQVLRLLCVD
jgi:hypothetical protein